jgi:hypothetical protein
VVKSLLGSIDPTLDKFDDNFDEYEENDCCTDDRRRRRRRRRQNQECIII